MAFDAPVALVLLVDGDIVECNGAASALLARNHGELLGTALVDHVHEEHHPRVLGVVEGSIDSDSPDGVVRCDTDPPRWMRLAAMRADDRVLVALTDVTAEVRTFRVLRESAWSAVVTDAEGTRTWGPVGLEHPTDRPNALAGSAVDRVHPEDMGVVLDAFHRVQQVEGIRLRAVTRIRSVDDPDRWATGSIELFNGRGIPEIGGILCRLYERDVGDATVASIGRTDSAFLSVAEAAPVGIVLTGPRGFAAYFNEAARRMLPGVGTGEADRDWISWIAVSERADARAWVDTTMQDGEPATRTWCFDGGLTTASWLVVTVAPRFAEGHRLIGHVVTLQDVTSEVLVRHELEEAQRRLHQIAVTDALTGLANRAGLAEALDDLAAGRSPWHGEVTAGPIGVAYCDLDRFKEVNDGLGHGAGDAVLQEVARRLEELVVGEGRVFRLGGDEFLVLTGPDPTRLEALATAIGSAIRQPIHVDGEDVAVGVSVGTASARPAEGVDEVLARADRAMYRRKRAAGDRRR